MEWSGDNPTSVWIWWINCDTHFCSPAAQVVATPGPELQHKDFLVIQRLKLTVKLFDFFVFSQYTAHLQMDPIDSRLH